MPALSLQRVLRDYDMGWLRLIADLWGVELQAVNQREAADELALLMLQPALVAEVVGALPAEAQAALGDLARQGHQPLAVFVRRHGELRAMGPARRDREKPWLNAPSPAEVLWYRGLIARAFFDEGDGPQEFAFIPYDLLPLLPPLAPPAAVASPAPAAMMEVAEPSVWVSAVDWAPNDAVTLLAYLQNNSIPPAAGHLPPAARTAVGAFLRLPEAADFWLALVCQLGLVEAASLRLQGEKARFFLELSRPEQTRALAEAWRATREWNDLFQLPGLIFEGRSWRNDPILARRAILELLAETSPGRWLSLESFVALVKERRPDFQRPAGDYDSWYIRDAVTQTYLRGFEWWERIDGALVRWFVQKPLYWLGLVETAGGERETVFRFTPYGEAFLGRAPWPDGAGAAASAVAEATLVAPGAVSLTVNIGADGRLCFPAAASSYDRFQTARIADWLPLASPAAGEYVYRLSAASLARAARQGIHLDRVIGFLEKISGRPLSQPLMEALRRWERWGTEVSLKETVILKVKDPKLLNKLRHTPAVRRYLGEPLGPLAVMVRREDVDKIRESLLEAGILPD